MDFSISTEELAWRDKVRGWAQTTLKRRAVEIDANSEFPRDMMTDLGKMGVLGMTTSPAYGGSKNSVLAYVMCMEEVARACGSTALSLAAHNSLSINSILINGSEEQKQKYLPPLASGKHIGAWGLTEPGSGSDAGGLATYGVRDGDGWRINGSKVFCTNGHFADTLTIMVKTERGASGNKGISAFIVERGTTGLKYGNLADKMGLKGSATSELFFEDMWLPKEQMLGPEGSGFKGALATLARGRISIGAFGLGLAQGALDAVEEYARGEGRQAESDGRPLLDNQYFQFGLADIATQVEAARLLVYESAALADAGEEFAPQNSYAKLYASEAGMRAATMAVQLLGPMGTTKRSFAERVFRDVKLAEIGEGTSEVQRLVIARHLGLVFPEIVDETANDAGRVAAKIPATRAARGT
ncbi:MAG TPA: acyl-CoA dehydrogenase family protein [Thermoplasmata archaeon]|nr:acyl-CoA dehydrogenase family protein [Thermoplasmata archaeon]